MSLIKRPLKDILEVKEHINVTANAYNKKIRFKKQGTTTQTLITTYTKIKPKYRLTLPA